MPPKSAHAAKREARRAKVADLLLAGASHRRIAQALDCDRRTVAADVDALLAQWAEDQKPEERERWRNLELAKLAEIEPGVLREAKRGSLGAVDREIRLMERRAKLLGLDAPTRQELTGKDGKPLLPETWSDLARSAHQVGSAGDPPARAGGSDMVG